jgi:hypothetical protein
VVGVQASCVIPLSPRGVTGATAASPVALGFVSEQSSVTENVLRKKGKNVAMIPAQVRLLTAFALLFIVFIMIEQGKLHRSCISNGDVNM